MKLTFDESAHRYQLDGETLPSVTTILGCAYRGPRTSPERLARAAVRGTRVHLWTEYDDRHGFPKDATQGMPFLGWRAAWAHWKRLAGWQTIHSEIRLFHAAMRYAGTCDRIGRLQGLDGYAVLDIKSGLMPATCRAQTAAYWRAAIDRGLLDDGPITLIGLRLGEHGDWTEHRYDVGEALRDWCAALLYYRRFVDGEEEGDAECAALPQSIQPAGRSGPAGGTSFPGSLGGPSGSSPDRPRNPRRSRPFLGCFP